MDRRQLLAAALAPLAWRVAPDALPSTAFAATAERDGKMSKTTQRIIECNGIHINIAEQGEGPLVLLVHGFPNPGSRGGIRSTRLLPPVSVLSPPTCAATARVMRRRRSTSTRSCILSATWSAFSMPWVRRPPLSSGMIGAPASPGRPRSCGPTASGRSAALSVPFRPRGKAPPTSLMPRTENAQFYQLYFQEEGPAEAELGRDPRATIRNMLFGASGDGVAAARAAAAAGGPAPNLGMVPKGGGFLQGPGAPKTLPSWLSESDIDFYGEEFRRSGFRGALNYYRNIDRNWEITGAMAGLQVTVPASNRGRSRLRGLLPRHGPVARKPEELRSRLAQDPDASRLRSLDPAGAAERSQRRARRIHSSPAEPLMTTLTSHRSSSPGNQAMKVRQMAMLAGPVLPTLLKLALPTVVVLVVQTLVGVAETYFVSFLGTAALAGVSLVFPIFMLMQMMSNGGIGGGVASSIARAMGAGKVAEAEALALNALVLAVVFGVSLPAPNGCLARPSTGCSAARREPSARPSNMATSSFPARSLSGSSAFWRRPFAAPATRWCRRPSFCWACSCCFHFRRR